MSTLVAIVLAFLKIVGTILDRADEANRAKILKALLDAARMEMEDDQAERARAAYRSRMSAGADELRDTYKHYRD